MANDVTATMGVDARDFNKGVDKAFGRVNNARLEPRLSLGKINADFTKFQDSLDSATARVIAFTATTSLIYGVGNAFTRLTQDAIKIESVMTRIQSIFGKTDSEMKSFQASIFDLANGVGLSFYQVAEAAEEFSRQGLSLNKTLEATRAAAIVAKLSGAELKGVIEGLTATLSTFNDGTLDYIQVANKLVALDSAFATSAAGITEGLKRVAGVAAEAGLSFDQTAAAITALKQVTGRSEAVIGNSLKSIFTSLQTEKVQKDLATLGVETKDASGEFRNLIDVLADLSKVYQTLEDAQKAVIAQKIGKTYQANAFQGILRTFETGEYEKAIGTSEGAGSNAEDRIEKLNKTTEAALTRFGNNITKLGSTLGDKLGKPLVETVAGYFNSLVDIANTTFGDSKIGDYLINGLKTTLEGPGVAIIAIALGKLLARITRETAQAVKSVAGISGRKENILEIEKFITQNLTDQNIKELEKVKHLDSVAARQKAILAIMQEQLAVAEKNRFASPLQQQYGVNLSSLDATKARKVAKKIPNRAVGDPAVNEAMIREAIDIKNGVGGARSTAIPQVKTLNLGRGPEKVVVNSDERIVPNFAGSGQHAVLNREMMGYAGGKLPSKIIGYHGTNAKFDKFDLDFAKPSVFGGLGFHFSESSDLPARYGSRIVKAELDIKNPYEFKSSNDFLKFHGVKPLGPKGEYLKSLDLQTKRDLKDEWFYSAARKGVSFDDFAYNYKYWEWADEVAKKLKNSGFDALKYKINSKNAYTVYDPDRIKILSNSTPSLASGDAPDFDKISKNILRQNRTENTKRKKSPYSGLQKEIATPISSFSGLTQKIPGLENYKFALPLGPNYFRKDINEGISGARQNQFIKDFQEEFSKELDKVIATNPVSFETVNRRGVRRQEVRQPSNLKYKPTGNFFDFRNNEFLKSVSPFDFSNRKYSFAGSGNAAFLQKAPFPISSPQLSGRRIFTERAETLSLGGGSITATPGTYTALPTGLKADLLRKKELRESGVSVYPTGYRFYDQNTSRAATNLLPPLGGNGTTGVYTTLPPLYGAASRVSPIQSSPSPLYTPLSPIRGIDKPIAVSQLGSPAVYPGFSEAARRARGEKITSIVSRGKLLGSSAKTFISSNRDLFSEEILQKYDSKKSFKNRFSGALSGFGDRALGAGLALSFVGGAVAQGYKTKEGEETQASRAIGGISQSVGLGSTAGIFGAKAGVAGLAIGALVGLNTALGENVDSLNGLSKAHENLQKKYSDESAAVNTYRENFISLSDAISSGSERAAKEARKNITTALSQIQDASFINKLSAAGTPQELSRVIDSLGSQRSRELAGSEAISYAAKLRQDNRRSAIDLFAGRNYSPGASSSELGEIIANSIDFSKLPKDFGITDLPKDAQEAIRIFSTGFKGTEIILKRIQDRANSVKGSEKAVDKINKVIAQAQDFSSTISASAQAANFKIFEKQLQNSLTNSLASINLESSKPFISESSFAKGQFSLDQNARNQKYLSDVSSVNSSILAKSQEILSGKTLTFNQLSKTQSSFSQFGEDQNIERFIKNISGVLGADSKELIKFSQEQFLELKKLNSEVSAANQEASARQRALLDEIKRNSLLKLFGGGVNRYDKTQVLPGLSAALRGPVLNKYENKGFGINPITRAPTYTPKEYSLEQGRVLDSNRLTAEQGIQRARYLYDNGYFGADDPSASPELKVLRESRLNEERKRLSGFFKTTLSANARDDTFFQSGEYINRINQDAINFSGSNIFGAKEKSDLAALLKSGDSKDVASARDYVTKIVKESGLLGQYSANSKGRESQNINDFIGFLGNRAEEVKYISESADLQAKSLLPGQTEAQKQVDLLTNIKTQEELANQNLSTIASLIASQDARIQSEKRASEYNIARSEYDKLQVKYEDDSQKFGSLISRYNEMTGIKRQFSGIGEFRNALQGSFRATKDAGGDADSIYSLIKEARTIQSTDEFLIKRSELKNIIDNNFKDVQTQTLEKLGESLKSTFDAAISKLESFVSGKGSSSEVSLNIDATVTGSDLYASDDFKSQLKDFVVSYTNQKIKENLLPGRVFIDRPTTMVA